MIELLLTKTFKRGVLEGETIEEPKRCRDKAEADRYFNLAGKRIKSVAGSDYELTAVRYMRGTK